MYKRIPKFKIQNSKFYRTFIFLSATLLLFAVNCSNVTRFIGSAGTYHTETYKKACNEWSREARIHRGLEVDLIVSATFKSEKFRRAYTDEYAKAYKLTSEDEKKFLENQVKAATSSHDFLIASYVPEKNWDDFNKKNSMWKLYLINDNNERVVPVEVRKVKHRDAVTSHFFPYITPWKSIYIVRFPHKVLSTNRPFINDNTKGIKLVITSVLGAAEMDWELSIDD